MFSLALIFCTFLAYAHSIRSVCYFANKAQYRAGIGTFTPANIDPMLCTHIVYSYAYIDNLELKPSEWNDEYPNRASGMYSKVFNLRNVNPNLKVLLAAGRIMETPERFFPAVETNISRSKFASNVVEHARDRTFDGVNLEWANLVTKSNSGYNKYKFLLLLKAIRSAVDADSESSGEAKLILTVTVPAEKRDIDTGYLMPEIAQQSDFISIRAFDMRIAEDKVVGLSSAFLSAPNARGDDIYLSVMWVASYYTSMGIPKDKINIGISTYGRTFQLKDEKHYQIGDEAVNDGDMGLWSGSTGIVGHYEMCQFIWERGTVVNVPAQGGRYYVDGVNWISYEDTLSVIQKACFIKTKGFGGITFWTLDLDDFSGQGCREGKYPIIATALSVISSPDMSPCTLLNSTDYVEALSANKTEPTTPTAPADSAAKMRVVCYYESWAYYWRGKAKFVPEDINPDLCTHIVYAYAMLLNYSVVEQKTMEKSEPWRKGLFDRFLNTQKRNPALKVLLGVTPSAEKTFPNTPSKDYFTSLARNAVSFIKKYGFHGLEFTWRPLSIEQKPIFLSVIQAFKSAIDEDASKSSSSRLILSVALPADKAQIDVYGKDIIAFEEATDFMSIRTHDFHGSWEEHTGFNAPLLQAFYESESNSYLNLHWVAKYYFLWGASKRKINIGIPTYARTYTLQDEMYNGPYAAAKGSGKAGQYTGQTGLLAFYEVCDFLSRGATIVQVPEQMVPYAFLGDQWVSYEDVDSVREKACYAKRLGFGGVSVWALDMDDFLGIACVKGRYPLLSTIYNITQNTVDSQCSDEPMESVSDAHMVFPDQHLVYMNVMLISVVTFYTACN